MMKETGLNMLKWGLKFIELKEEKRTAIKLTVDIIKIIKKRKYKTKRKSSKLFPLFLIIFKFKMTNFKSLSPIKTISVELHSLYSPPKAQIYNCDMHIQETAQQHKEPNFK